MMLIIMSNYLISVYELSKIYTNKFLKSYPKERFHQLISINQYFSYVFFKNLYFQSVSSFLPLIYRKLLKIDPSWFPPFYTSLNIKIFLFIHIISSVGLILNNEFGTLVDYFLLDPYSTYLNDAKEYSDIILSDGNKALKKEAIHVDLPNDLKTAKLTKNIIQVVLICITFSIVCCSLDAF